MAVYTKINKKDISYINKKFEIEKIISFKGIKQGIENTNYLLRSKNKKFILTIFEKRVSQNEICLLYTSPSPRDLSTSRMPSSA